MAYNDPTGLSKEHPIPYVDYDPYDTLRPEPLPPPPPQATPSPTTTSVPAQNQGQNYLYTYSENNWWRTLAVGQAVEDNVIAVGADNVILIDDNGNYVTVNPEDNMRIVFVQNQNELIQAITDFAEEYGDVNWTGIHHMWPEGINVNEANASSTDDNVRATAQVWINEISNLEGVNFESINLRGCEAAGSGLLYFAQNITQSLSEDYSTEALGSTTQTNAGAEINIVKRNGMNVIDPTTNGIVRVLKPLYGGQFLQYINGILQN
jgi:hypothetical protein